MDERITEMEGLAILRLQNAMPLIEQIITFKKPGEYAWRESFPTQYDEWTADSKCLTQSRVKSVRDFGYAATEFADELTKTNGSRRRIIALDKAAKRLQKTYDAFAQRELR